MNLESKYRKYLELVKQEQDADGFVDTKHCDSLLFSGLLGSAPGVKVNIKAAYNPKEKTWHRRPLAYPECFPQGSASTISRDMLLGLAWYCWSNNRLDIAEQVVSYALSHWLIMGKAGTFKDKVGRCLMTPGMLATWAEICYQLGGKNRWWLRYMPQVESSSVTGYQAHLCVLHVLLRKSLTKHLPKRSERVLQAHAKREPNNPLFQFAVGNVKEAEALLLNEKWWPSDRLPTRGDRKESWLVQRDYGKDWEPAEEDKEVKHSGGDFLFVAGLVLGLIK